MKNFNLEVSCFSEKMDVGIGFGVDFSSSYENEITIDVDLLECTMTEAFWENCFEFEEGIENSRRLIDDGFVSNVRDAVEIAFGEFDISFKINGEELDIDVDFNANEVMYSLLEQTI